MRYILNSIIICLFLTSGMSIQSNFDVVHANSHKHSVSEIARVINRAYSRVVWLKEGMSRTNEKEIYSVMNDKHKKLFVCVNNTRVCGTVILDSSSDMVVMSMLAVDPAFKGRSIGNVLMRHIENEAAKMHKDRIYIQVIPVGQEQLLNYYKRHGFLFENGEPQPFGFDPRIKPEYQGKLFLYTMSKQLNNIL